MFQNDVTKLKPFKLGEWIIVPSKNEIKKDNATVSIQPKLMEVLCYLCINKNRIINQQELIEACWPRQFISDSPVHKCIAKIRQALGDKPKSPQYILTIPKRGYQIVSETSINEIVSTPDPYWVNGSPFRGLQPYQQEHHKIFFGRSNATNDIISSINSFSEIDSKMLLVLGHSGSGKTSLVNAGVIPTLTDTQENTVLYTDAHTITLTGFDKQEPGKYLLSWLFKNKIISNNKPLNDYWDLLQKDISSICKFLTIAEIKDNSIQTKKIIIFVDQLENIFVTRHDASDVNIFFDLLNAMISCSGIQLLAAIRNEFYSDLIEVHSYINMRAKVVHYDLPPLNYDEVASVVKQPAMAAGLNYESHSITNVTLDNHIINQVLSSSISLPILQYTLESLYNGAKTNILTYDDYDAIGGVEGSLSTIAENAFLELDKKGQNRFYQILHNLVEINDWTKYKYTCKKVSLKHFVTPQDKRIIKLFSDNHLFQTYWVNNEPYIALANDILIKKWDRLFNWLEKNTILFKYKHELDVECNRWLANNKAKSILFDSEYTIELANRLVSNKHISLSQEQLEFIRLSKRKHSRTKLIKHSVIISLLIFSVISTILTFSVIKKNSQITETKTDAEKLISFILFDLKEKLLPIGKISVMELISDQTLKYYEKSGVHNTNNQSMLRWIESQQIAGEVNFYKGEYKKAREHFQLSEQKLIGLMKNHPDDAEVLEKYMLSSYWKGYLLLTANNFELARDNFDTYLETSIQLQKLDPGNNKWLLEQSYAYNNLGTLYLRQGDLDNAFSMFQSSLKIKKEIYQFDPANETLLADMADTVSWIGKIEEKRGRLKSALESNLKSLHLTEDLTKLSPANNMWKYRLSIALHRVSINYYDTGSLMDAYENIHNSVTIMEKLISNDPQNNSYKTQLINKYILLSRVLRHQNKIQQASKSSEKANRIMYTLKSNNVNNSKLVEYQILNNIELALIKTQTDTTNSGLQLINEALALCDNVLLSLKQSNNLKLSAEFVKYNLLKQKIPIDEGTLRLVKQNLSGLLGTFDPGDSRDYRKLCISIAIDKKDTNYNYLKMSDRIRNAHYSNPDYVFVLNKIHI